MVEIEDIKDRDSLKAWLETQPHKTSVAIAQRVAMRVLPLYWQWELQSAASRNDNLTALPILYRLLTSGVAANCPSLAITRYICEAAASATSTTAAVDVATIDATSAYTASNDAASAAAYVAYATYATFIIGAYTTTADRWRILRAECAELVTQGSLAGAKLWPNGENPYAEGWQQIKTALGKDSNDWSFWMHWYEAALNGEPLNQKMLEQIAVIPRKDWEQGPAHVNGLIAAIETEFELKAKIAELEGKLLQISSVGRGIGDNQGPPMSDEPVAKEIMIIWEPLQELKDEIEKESPSRNRLLKIAAKIGELATAISKWTAGMANFAIKTYIGLSVAKLSTEADPVASMLAAINDLVRKLAGYLP